jgi:uncharacterized protein DUF4440
VVHVRRSCRQVAVLALVYLAVPDDRRVLLAQPADSLARAALGIRAAEAARFRAMVRDDLTALDTLLGADLSYTHTSGERQTKAELESMLRAGDLTYLDAEPESVSVRVYGTAAMADGRARMRVRSQGQERAFTIRFLEAYVFRHRRWELVAWQSTRLPAPHS